MVKPFLDWLIEKYGNAEGVRRFREWQKAI
jgi:hypothetical protein